MNEFDLTIDIETIPTQDKELEKDLRESIAPPGNYKSEEAISKWWATTGETAGEKKFRDTALDGSYGEIVCVSFALGDRDPMGAIRRKGDSEESFLDGVFNMLDDELAKHVRSFEMDRRMRVIGHNIINFDLPFLFKRCVVNQVKAHTKFGICANPRPNEFTFDTMVEWAGSSRVDKAISCHNLCRVLGIPSPKSEEIDGSKVYDHWLDEKYNEILDYCIRDVVAEREIARRIMMYA